MRARVALGFICLAGASGCTLEFDPALLDKEPGGCQGCFDGVSCRSGDSPAACGSEGKPCAVCKSPAALCESQRCVVDNAVTSISGDVYFSVAVDRKGRLWAWGTNITGTFALDPSVVGSGGPLVVADIGAKWRTAAAGGDTEGHVCAITDAGALYCWGAGGNGELGDGLQTGTFVPSHVGNSDDWLEVAVGSPVSCGVRAPGSLWCWGWNGEMRLGLTDISGTGDKATPQSLDGFDDYRGLSYGSDHGCAIRQGDASLWCWGVNTGGLLGVDGPGAPPAPVKSNASSWKQVSAGRYHTCGIRGLDKEGTLWCWGDNSAGQLGLAASVTEPTQVDGNTDWSSVSAGGAHTCAIRRDGTLWCWGDNTLGQLGNGTGLPASTPTRVGETTDWIEVDAGPDHTLGIRSDGSMWAWGGNDQGQSGLVAATPTPSVVELKY